MSKSPTVTIPRVEAQELIRLAIDGLRPFESVVTTAISVGEKWLRRHVTRLHARGQARYTVRVSPRSLEVVRKQDATQEGDTL